MTGEVAESVFDLMLAQCVDYFLHGHGSNLFRPLPHAGEIVLDADDADVVVNASRRRLEAVGQDVGQRLVERYVQERDRLSTDLEVVKFICKDFWELTFKKQVDVLRTNHRGLYVLTDNNFRWLSKVSHVADESKKKGQKGALDDYLVFPCGLICGALTRLGIKCRVSAEMSPVPLPPSYKCSFSVQVINS